jgi:Fe2+ transport system protein FeoA
MRDHSRLLRLDQAEPGVYTVFSLGGGGGLSGKLAGMGIVPGARIEVFGRFSGRAESGRIPPGRGFATRGPVEVAAGGARFRLGRGLSARVLLETRGPGASDRAETAHKAFLTLRDYKEGQRGRIQEVRGEGRFRKRLLEMGFVKGTEVYVEKYAPLFDPVEYVVKGYHVSLRRDEAEKILMSEPE